jgi:manganese/iron transport system permease protein/iron/zinc/copper transport system permease protein
MMTWINDIFLAPLSAVYFQKALIGGCVVAAVCGVTGSLVILRRMAFLGDALSHAMIAGFVAGYLFMQAVFDIEASAPAMLVGSIIAAVTTVMMIGFVSKSSRLKEDTVIGIMYCGVFAVGIVVLTIFQDLVQIDIMHFIMGDVLGISDGDLWLSVIVAASVLTVMILGFRQFQITSFDPIMAASIGIPVLFFDYLLTICMSFVVVSTVSMVGVILSVGLLITPAATAYLLTDRLNRMMIIAAFLGITSVIGGLFLSVILDASGGVSIILFCTMQFLLVLVIAPQYGLLADWLRKRRMVPQALTEDILKETLKIESDVVKIKTIAKRLALPSTTIIKGLRSLVRDEYIILNIHSFSLTETGRQQARRIVRAHRLWESYLAHVGTPIDQIHNAAETLEHIHDEKAVDFIDDMLGHPTKDPHGSEIPDDFMDASKGMIAPISLLRKGRQAKICIIRETVIDSIDIKIGEDVTLGARTNDGKTWVIIKENGNEVHLDHKKADLILAQTIN